LQGSPPAVSGPGQVCPSFSVSFQCGCSSTFRSVSVLVLWSPRCLPGSAPLTDPGTIIASAIIDKQRSFITVYRHPRARRWNPRNHWHKKGETDEFGPMISCPNAQTEAPTRKI
jgi:hypothetical protein